MSNVSVDVVQDQDAGGGHAVIKLNGVYLLPPQSGFRIDPLDDGDAPADGWPKGEQRPQDVRVTPEGVELLVGPEIVDSPALQPGTPVVVSVPAVDVRHEIRWPTLAVSMAPRRRAVIVSAAQRAAEAAAAKARVEAEVRAKAEAEETARLEAEARQRAIEERVRREEDERAKREATEKADAEAKLRADSAQALEQNRASVVATHSETATAIEAAQTAERRAAEAKARDVARETEKALVDATAPLAADVTTTALTHTEIALTPPERVTTTAPADEGDAARATRDAAARLASLGAPKTPAEGEARGLAKLDLDRSTSRVGEAGPSPVPAPPVLRAKEHPTVAAEASPQPKAKVPQTVDELPHLPQRRSGVLPFLMGMLLPVAIGFAGFYALSRNGTLPAALKAPIPQASTPTTISTGSVPTPAPQRVDTVTAPHMGDLVRVGDVSPRGRSASGVDLTQALSLADRNLHGIDQSVDREEARYWLRKALSLSLNSEQMTWAITQLGALYASPVGAEAADYEKARTLWEISGSHGDPVAHCFIASLFEHGLGVAADKRAALKHFTEARRLGGCRGVDQAIARLSP